MALSPPTHKRLLFQLGPNYWRYWALKEAGNHGDGVSSSFPASRPDGSDVKEGENISLMMGPVSAIGG